MIWAIRLLQASDHRARFTCGTQPAHIALDKWFHDHAWNYVAKKFAAVFVAVAAEGEIDGFYSLNSGSVPLPLLPKSETIRFPRHPVPVAHIGRLAHDVRVRGQQLDGDLLIDAISRAGRLAKTEIGIAAIEVYASDEAARKFYAKHGFVSLLDDPHHLYLSMKTAQKLFT